VGRVGGRGALGRRGDLGDGASANHSRTFQARSRVCAIRRAQEDAQQVNL
jgi:hypothetical protein